MKIQLTLIEVTKVLETFAKLNTNFIFSLKYKRELLIPCSEDDVFELGLDVWDLILVNAAAASSRALLTDDVNRRNTSGSVKAFPSAATPVKYNKTKLNHIKTTKIISSQ